MVPRKRNTDWLFILRVIGVLMYIAIQAVFIGLGIYMIKSALGIDLIKDWSLFH